MIRLEEYLLEQQKLIIEFQKYWREMHSKNAESYPAILEPGDWDEQFKSFQDLKG